MSDETAESSGPLSAFKRLLSGIPGGDIASAGIERMEQRVITELRARMERSPDGPGAVALRSEIPEPRQDAKNLSAPGGVMRRLLQRAEQENETIARNAWALNVVRNLLPEEAKLLQTLATAEVAFAVLELEGRAGLGNKRKVVLDLESNVGKVANLQCLELVPWYLARLRTWGLLQIGDEERALELQYQLLETQSHVREAQAAAAKTGWRCKPLRKTLRLSPLGHALWAACRISEEPAIAYNPTP